MEDRGRATVPAGLTLLLVALLATLSATHVSAAEPVAAIPVKPLANLSLADISGPLQPLTKVDCGNATVVVYGVEQGKPVVVVVYAASGDWRSSLPRCIEALRPCLVSLGAEALDKLEALAARKALTLTVAASVQPLARVEPSRAEAVSSPSTTAPEKGAKAAATTIAAERTVASNTATLRDAGEEPATARSRSGLARAGLVLLSGAAAATVTMAWARRAATP